MIRLVIADDHAVVRRGLKEIVSAERDMSVVGEATSTDDLLALMRRLYADLVVLDISMPGRSGLEALRDLRHDHPGSRVLVMSIHPESQYAVRAMKAGAGGYVTKETAPDELVKAIRKVMSGGCYVSPSFGELMGLGLVNVTEQPAHDRLSDREHEVVRLLVSGKLVSEIAEDLMLSVKTISTYKQRALDKLGVRTVAEVTRYAIEHRLFAHPAA
jgi:two-component system, NarL family, invasion response regulator UvrY